LLLFIAHNSHQEKYFKFLKDNLKLNNIVVKRASVSVCKAPKLDISQKYKEIDNKYNNSIQKFLYKYFLKYQSKLIYCYYKKIIQQYNPSLIGVWNGIKYPQNILNLFKQKKIYFENGFLPNTTQADCKGVNFFNSVIRDRKFYENLDYYKKPLPTILIPRKITRKLEGTQFDITKKYIFIPLQVNYDSQIIYFSPWIKSMQEFFELINEIADYFNDLNFVFKIHPNDKATNYKEMINKTKKNVYFAVNNTQELIQHSEAVITINSSVGIESLLFEKKVITLGNAFYNIEGITQHANNKKELINIIENLYKYKIDKKLIKNFVGYLYYEYLIPSTWKNPDKNHIEKLTNRIKQCL